ncbi:maltokinase N-terminal cap-like domain-containing protein [Conexibacter woesei]|uniref:maltokinase N-terminal cap-like domain-containing protein n=1 Tax=Conexibacter woesei TaxID=191495 RepID=UPI00041A819F|nr:phosphotransferase [Conexibacter woesei]
MTAPVRELRLPSEDALREFVIAQRWFGSKSKEVAHFRVLETIPLTEQPLGIAILEVEFLPGTHELYQLPIGARPEGEAAAEGVSVICTNEGMTIYDAMSDDDTARRLVRMIAAGTEIETGSGTAEFHAVGDLALPEIQDVRPMGAEQSNSSVVLDEKYVLKAYRRLGAGPNPELEILRFLTERDFPHIAALRGWYGHSGRLIDATLGIVQDFLTGATDGWDLALADLREDPQRFVARARALGEVTGRMHTALGSDGQDPAFAPEETSTEALGLITATVDEEIERMFVDLPDDLEALEPIRGRGQEVRDQLRRLTQVGSAGKVIRHHGDYHLGQVMFTADEDWVVLDFEGEPARTLIERRRKRSPLRDVAGMLRSFAYAATASELLHGAAAPEGWEQSVRTAYLDGYIEESDQSLLPPGRAAVERLLAVFELEKAVYELRYELDNRPDWVKIPVAGIARLLEPETTEPEA